MFNKESKNKPAEKKAFIAEFSVKVTIPLMVESEEKAQEAVEHILNHHTIVGGMNSRVELPSKYGITIKEVTKEVQYFMKEHTTLG